MNCLKRSPVRYQISINGVSLGGTLWVSASPLSVVFFASITEKRINADLSNVITRGVVDPDLLCRNKCEQFTIYMLSSKPKKNGKNDSGLLIFSVK